MILKEERNMEIKLVLHKIIALAGALFIIISMSGCDAVKSDNDQTVTGIIGALEEETALLKENMTDVKTVMVSGMVFYEGRLGNNNVVVVKCGMGKVNAGICTQTLIERFGADRVINTGVAGSLDASINIGDIVVSTDAV